MSEANEKDTGEEQVEDVELQPETTTTAAAAAAKEEEEEGGGVSMGKIHVTDAQVPMVLMFFCAVILLVAVVVGYNGRLADARYGYSVAVPSVSMVLSAVGFGLTFSDEKNATLGKYNAHFLFLWNFIGACILTFGGPFTQTGNGYFAAWGLVVASMIGVGVTGSEAKSVVGRMGALLGLGASSIVVVIAIIPKLSNQADSLYRNGEIYAMTVACCSIVVVIVYQKFIKGGGMVKFLVLAFFAILWIVLACIVTFNGPFLTTGNGYFGSWGGAITCTLAAMAALKEK
jgi:hypothetical protein